MRVFQSALSLLLARAEFAGVELSLARAQLMRWIAFALAASALAMLGLIGLSAVLVLALWDRYGWVPLGVLTALYCLGAAWLGWRVLDEVASTPPLLSQTFDELAKDRIAVFGAPAATRDGADE